MEKEKRNKILIIAGLIALILIVVITSIILYQKKKELDDLKDKNDIVKPDENEEESDANKIFLKNFEIFIDINGIIC